MVQNTAEAMRLVRHVKLSRGDRLIAESAARGVEPSVELLCKICSKIRSAIAGVEPLIFLPGRTDL